VAGLGQFGADVNNYWEPRFEGGPATDANLSRPHFAMADDAGNIYIADKDSHSILQVTPDGTIHTVAGTHEAGSNGNGPTNGTNLQLNFPNGLWVRGDGTVYILDTDNGKVRRLATNGIITTMFTVSGGIDGGRGLWVRNDESLVYFASLQDLRKWTPGGGVSTLNGSFNELGNIVVDRNGNVIATDRGDHSVWRVNPVSGSRVRIAGNRTTTGGGDGFPALQTGLAEVRGVWYLPNNGYLLATHQGSRIWYVDPAGIIHLFLDGAVGGYHAGDGEWFYSPGFKVSEVRSVTMDRLGNILIVENDVGYVRKIQFLRLEP
jgi:sugar lactone lactonase YvrE